MSQKYEIAHIRRQGIDLVIVPLEERFSRLSDADQQEVINHLQGCAGSAGLAGKVVPVWRQGSGFQFIAPTKWHPFFKSLSWLDIASNINKTLTCS